MLDQVIVIDDFFNKSKFKRLKTLVNSGDQDWYLRENISIDNEGDPKKFYGVSCNIVLHEYPEQYTDVICSDLIFALNEQIKSKFSFNEVIRCRLDMTTYRGEESLRFGPHIDCDGKHFTSIFYLTTCNAPTIIYKEKLMTGDPDPKDELNVLEMIEAKENRLVVFDGNYIHTGMCSTDVSHRILVNSNFV